MGYALVNGNVVLTMTPADYQELRFFLGCSVGIVNQDSIDPNVLYRLFNMLNRISSGDPNYIPYNVPTDFQNA